MDIAYLMGATFHGTDFVACFNNMMIKPIVQERFLRPNLLVVLQRDRDHLELT